MEQEKLDQLFQLIADALVAADTHGRAGEVVMQIKEWMNFNAPEYWNYSKDRSI